MPMHQVIITPWRYHSELLDVKDAFYRPTANGKGNGGSHDSFSSAPPDQSWRQRQNDACETVRAWELLGNVPHAIVATAELTAALLFDRNVSDGLFRYDGGSQGSVSVPSTQLVGIRLGAYMSAWTRFVDGMTDTAQDRRMKRTMYSIARDIGMPLSFIELRHRAVHEGKPMLHEFRQGVREGLAWLFKWYWAYVQPEVDREAEGTEGGGEAVTGKGRRKRMRIRENGSEEVMDTDGSGDKDKNEHLRAHFGTLITAYLDSLATKQGKADVDKAVRVLVDAVRETCSNTGDAGSRDEDDGHSTTEDPRRIFAECLLRKFFGHPQLVQTQWPGKLQKPRPQNANASFILAAYEPPLLALARASPSFVVALEELLITTIIAPSSVEEEADTEERTTVEQEEEDEGAEDFMARASAVSLLLQTHTDAGWAEFRHIGLISDDVLLDMCHEHENQWTHGLAVTLEGMLEDT